MVVVAAAAESEVTGGDGIKEHAQFGRLAEIQYNGGIKAGSARNMEAVAHVDLAARGYNADVWTHKGYAYVGQWGFSIGRPETIASVRPTKPRAEARSIDARVPAQAKWVSRLAASIGTSIEDIVVFTARYGAYAGREDIAVGGIQYCGADRYDIAAERGLMLWDVTRPKTRCRSAI